MKRLVITLLVIVISLVFTSIPWAGQFKTYQQAHPTKTQDELVGKYFWLLPKSGKPGMVAFCRSTRFHDTKYKNRLYPTGITRVKVLELIPRSPETKFKEFYKLQFDDGGEGYIEKTKLELFIVRHTSSNLTKHTYGLAETYLKGMSDLWFSEHPDKLRAKVSELKREEQKAYEDQRAKGIAKMGMSESQVINDTMWGKPHKRNRTVVKGAIHEQWVYGNNQYLYFTNGKLTSWQN